jgi:hypothetical protein
MGKVLVTAKIENLEDLYDVREGRLADADVRRVEVPDALVHSEVFGLLMPLRLVEQLGLHPVGARWVTQLLAAGRPTEFPRPIPHHAVRLTIQGRECSMEVGAIADDQPVVIGQIALDSMDWVIDAEGGRLIGNPEHGGEEMYDIFSNTLGLTIANYEQP